MADFPVVLIQAPAWGVMCPPYGIAVLKSSLAERGWRVRTLDLNLAFYRAAPPALKEQWGADRHLFWMDPGQVDRALGKDLAGAAEAAVRMVAGSGARVVGFSCLYSNQEASLHLARRIKRAAPGCVVVFGGPQASRLANGAGLIAQDCVDFVVEGEGEETFARLLELLRDGGDPASCPGLLYKKEGRPAQTPPRPLIADLSSRPFADFTDFDMDAYTEGCIPVSIGRGCPNDCAFCYEVVYWDRFRVRKGESLVREIAHQRKLFPKAYMVLFHDSLVNGHMGELRNFAQGLIDAGIPTRWAAQAVIRKEMTRELLELLKRSGCICLNYGLESASFSVMLRMGKRLAKGAEGGLDRIIRDTAEAGIDCILNFMFGFPGETEEDFAESLDFVRRNKDWITMVQPSPGFCDFYKGTRGHTSPEAFGISLREGSAHWSSTDGTNTYLTRMERFERFLELVHSLGIKCSYPHKALYLKNTIVGNYYHSYGEHAKAIPWLEEAVRSEPPNETVARHLAESRLRAGSSAIQV